MKQWTPENQPMNRAHERDLERRLRRVYTDAIRHEHDRGCTTQEWAESAGLRAVYDLGRQHGAAQATCPYIKSSDEGTSYCALAEQGAAPVTPMDELCAASAEARPGGLWERMEEAGRREFAAATAELLEQEVDRGSEGPLSEFSNGGMPLG